MSEKSEAVWPLKRREYSVKIAVAKVWNRRIAKAPYSARR